MFFLKSKDQDSQTSFSSSESKSISAWLAGEQMIISITENRSLSILLDLLHSLNDVAANQDDNFEVFRMVKKDLNVNSSRKILSDQKGRGDTKCS